MRGLRGVLAGSLALVALHTLVAYRDTNRRLEQLVGGDGLLVGFVTRFLDPSVPAIPERTKTVDKQVGAAFPKPPATTSPAGSSPAPRQPAASTPSRPPANAI